MNLRHLNPFAQPPGPFTLVREELSELCRLHYLEDKRADHHREQADALARRILKLEQIVKAGHS